MGDYLHNFVIKHFSLDKSAICFHKTIPKSFLISMLHLLCVMKMEMFTARLNSSGM
jgi:hypothetical protein